VGTSNITSLAASFHCALFYIIHNSNMETKKACWRNFMRFRQGCGS